MGLFDANIKAAVRRGASALHRYLELPEGLQPMDTDLSRGNERRCDFLASDGLSNVYQVEFQVVDDPSMAYRMFHYFVRIHEIEFDKRLKKKLRATDAQEAFQLFELAQLVLYLGRRQYRLPRLEKGKNLSFSYAAKQMRDAPYDDFLRSDDPSDVALSILCAIDDIETAVTRTMTRLEALLEIRPYGAKENQVYEDLYVLSSLRSARNLVQERLHAMGMTITLTRSKCPAIPLDWICAERRQSIAEPH